MKKQIIKLTEGDLHRIIENSVKRIIREEYDEDEYDENNPMNVLSDFEEKTKIYGTETNAFSIVSNFTYYMRYITKYIEQEIVQYPEKKDALIKGFIRYMNNIIRMANNNINIVKEM